jgi:hypothetical protein
MRPVYSTDAAVYGNGGIKKSAALTAFPCAVVTEIRPEADTSGTVVLRLVAVADVTDEAVVLNLRAFSDGVVAKLVPVTVTAVPGAPILGLNPVIVGAPVDDVTVKTELLLAEPPGEVTAIAPVVAPLGTLVTIFVVVDDVTEAVTPLKVTVFWLGVALKPVPKIETTVPTGPLLGVNSITETTDEA